MKKKLRTMLKTEVLNPLSAILCIHLEEWGTLWGMSIFPEAANFPSFETLPSVLVSREFNYLVLGRGGGCNIKKNTKAKQCKLFKSVKKLARASFFLSLLNTMCFKLCICNECSVPQKNKTKQKITIA